LNPRVSLPFLVIFMVAGCASTSLPGAKHEHYLFPQERVYFEEPSQGFEGRPYQTMGWVRSKATWSTLENETHDERLCRNYFNKAAHSLLKEAIKAGADAVIKVRSVVMLLDGKIEYYPSPQCSDDGAEGEVLMQGIAIKFKKLEVKAAK
jgi:hypothetical protein